MRPIPIHPCPRPEACFLDRAGIPSAPGRAAVEIGWGPKDGVIKSVRKGSQNLKKTGCWNTES